MKANQVQMGETYTALVSGKVVHVQIIGPSIHSGWIAKNLTTGRMVRIRTAQRLRERVEGRGGMPAFSDQWQAMKQEHPGTILLFGVGPARFITCGKDVRKITEVCGSEVFTTRTEDAGMISAASIDEVTRKMAAIGQRVLTCNENGDLICQN